MNAEMWREKIGADLFNHLVEVACRGEASGEGVAYPDMVAAVLSEATEMGFTAPVKAPRVSPGGTKTLWPRADGKGYTPVLTTEGLLDYYDRRGHRFYLLRVGPMLRGHRGPLATRLQESLAVYETQCEVEGLPAVPEWADCRLFVGGDPNRSLGPDIVTGLREG